MCLPAIVLAAGASRRLGQPKQLVILEGETLLARTIRVAREAGANPICVVLGAYTDEILARVDTSNADLVQNPAWEEGIASSIRAGMRWLEGQIPAASGTLLLVCDQPHLTAQHLRKFFVSYTTGKDSCIVASTYAGIRGVPAIIPKIMFPHLLALEGDQGARKLLQNPSHPVVEVSFEAGVVDIDTAADLSTYFPRIKERQWTE